MRTSGSSRNAIYGNVGWGDVETVVSFENLEVEPSLEVLQQEEEAMEGNHGGSVATDPEIATGCRKRRTWTTIMPQHITVSAAAAVTPGA